MKPLTISKVKSLDLNTPLNKTALGHMTRQERIVLSLMVFGGKQHSTAKRLGITLHRLRKLLFAAIAKINWVAEGGPKNHTPMPEMSDGRRGPKPRKRGPSIEEFNDALQRLRASSKQSSPKGKGDVYEFLSRTLPQAIPENLSASYDRMGNVLSVTLTYSSPHRNKP